MFCHSYSDSLLIARIMSLILVIGKIIWLVFVLLFLILALILTRIITIGSKTFGQHQYRKPQVLKAKPLNPIHLMSVLNHKPQGPLTCLDGIGYGLRV